MHKADDYTRKAVIERVIDGDTFSCVIDMGLRIYKRAKVRVLGVNCPELKGQSKAAGMLAKAFTKDWFAENKDFIIQTVNEGREDSFGRLLANVYSVTGQSLGDALLENGLAEKYAG